MNDLLDFFDTILWSSILIYLLCGTGIYLTFRLRFIQFRHFGHLFSPLFISENTSHEVFPVADAVSQPCIAYWYR